MYVARSIECQVVRGDSGEQLIYIPSEDRIQLDPLAVAQIEAWCDHALPVGVHFLDARGFEMEHFAREIRRHGKTLSQAGAIDAADVIRTLTQEIKAAGIGCVINPTVQWRPPGARSTTYDFIERRPVGLHIDNYTRVAFSDAVRCWPRLTLNLGERERYFSFATLSVKDMFALLGLIGSKEEQFEWIGATKLAHRVLEKASSIHLVLMSLPPLTGYVANTQLLIHDGVGGGGHGPDLWFTGWLQM